MPERMIEICASKQASRIVVCLYDTQIVALLKPNGEVVVVSKHGYRALNNNSLRYGFTVPS